MKGFKNKINKGPADPDVTAHFSGVGAEPERAERLLLLGVKPVS